MPKRIVEHPVLGLLVPDKWGEHVTLRKFPFLPEFARSRDDPDDEDRPLIADWQRHIHALAPRAREFSLRGGLHHEGVFEVYVEYAGEVETPFPHQVVAFAAFVAHEQEVCRNLVDATLRYYRAARREMPEWFDEPPEDTAEFPDNPDPAALASVLQFDRLTIRPTAVAGVAPLIFYWSPAWAEEHALQSLVYDGQVLMVGSDEVSDMECGPSEACFNVLWNRSTMTPAEIAAYEAYRRARSAAEGG